MNKKRYCIYIFFIILFVSCVSTNIVTLGEKYTNPLSRKIHDGANCTVLLDSATILPLYKHSKYINFGLENGVIKFIMNNNPGKCISGLKIGNKIDKFLQKGNSLMVEIGVCYFVILDDNWYGFVGDINKEFENEQDLQILYFYRKELNNVPGFIMNYQEYKTWLNTIGFPSDIDDHKILGNITIEEN